MSPHFGKAVPGWLQCRVFAALMCVSVERCVPLQLCLPQGRLEESDILVVDPLHIFGFHAFIHFFLSAYHPQCPVARSCIVELHVVWRLKFCFANLHPALILLPWSSYRLVTLLLSPLPRHLWLWCAGPVQVSVGCHSWPSFTQMRVTSVLVSSSQVLSNFTQEDAYHSHLASWWHSQFKAADGRVRRKGTEA